LTTWRTSVPGSAVRSVRCCGVTERAGRVKPAEINARFVAYRDVLGLPKTLTHPISAAQLTERLRQLGIHSARARSTALFALPTELPAALLARMLGIHISAAVAWQRASAGDWTTYAAEVSRRNNTLIRSIDAIPTHRP
jgi:hypothetical protein